MSSDVHQGTEHKTVVGSETGVFDERGGIIYCRLGLRQLTKAEGFTTALGHGSR